MSREPEVPLKEYIEALIAEMDRRFDRRFIDEERAVDAAFESAKEAVLKAETASEKRLDLLNEFRGQLADQATSFIGRPEYKAQHEALIDRVDGWDARFREALERVHSRLDVAEGSKAGKIEARTVVFAVVGILLALASFLSAYSASHPSYRPPTTVVSTTR